LLLVTLEQVLSLDVVVVVVVAAAVAVGKWDDFLVLRCDFTFY